ncbi:hypothetical protein NKH36_00025 [Mesorhizobium sp. M1312]|uniref:hypothetical protein n=1 Tax=unclassified Mesorhizobium TaxID=325217 RepID=UPI00333C849F
MACLICGEERTIDAHLIPRAFAVEIQASPGEKHVLTSPRGSGFKTTNTGRYDRNILCGKCDGILGKHEGYAFSLLTKARAQHTPPGRLLAVDPLDGDGLVRFAAGIAWKYAVTKPEFGRISVGPYESVLADVAFERTDVPQAVDVSAFQLQAGDSEAYFYRMPLLDRKEGVNLVRFSVGGFVFILKVDRRPNPSMPPAECWLRGKTAGAFMIAPAHLFEEWNLHAESYQTSGATRFFTNMRNRKATARAL